MNNMDIANVGVVRINITVPKKLLSELEKEVPKRGKSSFVSKAIEEKLARKKKDKALRELVKLPPTFTDIKDGAVYIAEERTRQDKERTKRLGL